MKLKILTKNKKILTIEMVEKIRKIRIIKNEHSDMLENEVNEFLENINKTTWIVEDIKYNAVAFSADSIHSFYSVMIILSQ